MARRRFLGTWKLTEGKLADSSEDSGIFFIENRTNYEQNLTNFVVQQKFIILVRRRVWLAKPTIIT
jgi:hypothetical protein